MLVWRSYQSDLGRAYPMFALSVRQINEVSSNVQAIDLLPPEIKSNSIDVCNSCGVDGLISRQLVLFTNDGGQFSLSYPLPWTQTLFDYLTASTAVTAFEFVGERVKYGRLKKMLNNV